MTEDARLDESSICVSMGSAFESDIRSAAKARRLQLETRATEHRLEREIVVLVMSLEMREGP